MSLPRRDELDDMLQQTLEDRRLSRTERRALAEVFADHTLNDEERAFVRNRVFAIAREQIKGMEAQNILEWAEDVVKVLHSKAKRDSSIAEVYFSPGDECRLQIARQLRRAKRSADVCVFTITDDRLAAELLDAHNRKVAVRIVSDNDKAYDMGSDVQRLAKAGVEVCVDQSDHHMHHKFAIFDSETILTGSYNWTRSAAKYNRENIMVSDDPKLVMAYQKNFDELWGTLSKGSRLTASR